MEKFFSKAEAKEKVGKRVRALMRFPGVPQGTTGEVVAAIQSDVKVEWKIGGRGKNPADWFNRRDYEKCLQEIDPVPQEWDLPENVLSFLLAFFTRKEAEEKVGKRVKALIDLPGFPTIPKGTTGRVVRTAPGTQVGAQLKSWDVVVEFDSLDSPLPRREKRFSKDEYEQKLVEIE